MMRIAYLILAHQNPRHLSRLLAALRNRDDFCFVHLDKKSDATQFSLKNKESVEVLEQRIAVYWGDFSQVEAIQALLLKSLMSGVHFDYFMLLSGSDYPLHSTHYIHAYLEYHRGQEFINAVKLPCAAASKPLSRIRQYQPCASDSWVQRKTWQWAVRSGLRQAERDYREALGALQPYAGSTWWGLSHAAASYALNFCEQHPEVVDYFRNAVCPDESFFQTILCNSPFAEKIRRNLTYADWSAGGARPSQLNEQHVTQFERKNPWMLGDVYGRGEALFARKFSDQDDHLITRLDQNVRQREKPHKSRAAVINLWH